MASKTMEDWFLRGGAKPQPAESRKGSAELAVCQNCGGMNIAEETECTHCGAPLTGGCSTGEYCGAPLTGGCSTGEYCGDDDEGVLQDWIVTISRTRSVQQTAKVRVKAHSEEEALDLIEDRVEAEAENWAWKDAEGTEEYGEPLVDGAEEAQ